MPTRYIRVAINDGNGNQTATPGVSKWVPLTILEVYDADFTPEDFKWGDECAFLLLKVQKDDVGPNLLANIKKRKYKISLAKLKAQFEWTDTQVQKYKDNYTNIMKTFFQNQQVMPYDEALAIAKADWAASGTRPIFTKTLDLDEIDIIEQTPEWQWAEDVEIEE